MELLAGYCGIRGIKYFWNVLLLKNNNSMFVKSNNALYQAVLQ